MASGQDQYVGRMGRGISDNPVHGANREMLILRALTLHPDDAFSGIRSKPRNRLSRGETEVGDEALSK